MDRIKINFNPTPEQVLEATEYMGDTENYDAVNQLAWTGNENAMCLFGAYKGYLEEVDQADVWLVHFLLVYRTAKGEVRS